MLLTACNFSQRPSSFSARSGPFAVSGSSNFLFVGNIAKAVKGMTEASSPPPISHLRSYPDFQATDELNKPATAKETCMTVAFL